MSFATIRNERSTKSTMFQQEKEVGMINEPGELQRKPHFPHSPAPIRVRETAVLSDFRGHLIYSNRHPFSCYPVVSTSPGFSFPFFSFSPRLGLYFHLVQYRLMHSYIVDSILLSEASFDVTLQRINPHVLLMS